MDDRPAARRIDEIIVGQRHPREPGVAPVASIVIRERLRRDMGDLSGLAASIALDGLLHPIIVSQRLVLLAGERRLRACRDVLGWREIPVTIVEDAEIAMKLDPTTLGELPRALRIEISENLFRKPLKQSELAAQQARILAILRGHTQQGRRTDLEGGTSGKAFPQVEARATDVVGRLFGESRKQVEKRLAIVEAAEAEPERYGKLLADMDRTARVNGSFKRLTVWRQAERLRAEPPPLPNGKWRVAVIDFPWPYDVRQDDPSHRAARPYAEMSIAQICAKAAEFRGLLHDDAIVWLWCTNYHLIRYAAPALDALGVRERSILTWVKDRFGTGDLLRSQTEPCVMAVRGKLTVTLTNEATVLFAPLRGHSQKPPEFYDLVERLCPASGYLDLFSRYRHSALWTCWGAEAPLEREAEEARS